MVVLTQILLAVFVYFALRFSSYYFGRRIAVSLALAIILISILFLLVAKN